MCIGLIAATVIVAQGASAAPNVRQGDTPRAAPMTSYADFMKLPADQRSERFPALTAENKATIYRTHAERWLSANRGRLTGSEIAVFEEIIAFITPELYGPRIDGALDKRQEALEARMRCRVSDDDVMQMMNVCEGAAGSPPQTPKWTYLSQAKCWVEWIAEGLADYVPTLRR